MTTPEGRPLSLGSVGEAVSELHRRLGELGHVVADDELARQQFGDTTEAAVRRLQAEAGIEPTGTVDEPTLALLGLRAGPVGVRPADPVAGGKDEGSGGSGNGPGEEVGPPDGGAEPPNGGQTPPEFQFLVRGDVRYKGGLPIEGVGVVAVDKELRTESILGLATTDAQGAFEIYYSLDGVARKEKRSPDLVVRAYRSVGGKQPNQEEPLAESRVIFKAQRIVKVRLLVDGGPERTWSEYEQLTSELEPLLDGVAIGDLVEDDEQHDVTLLAGKTGQPLDRVAALVVSHKLAAKTDLPPEVFYGLVRQQQPTNLAELLAVDPSVQRQALSAAIAAGMIPGRLHDQLDDVQAGLRREAARYAGATQAANGTTPLGAVLGTVLDEQLVGSFLHEYVSSKGSIKDFWHALAEKPELGDAVPRVQTTLQLAVLTGNHLPLVRTLQQMQERGEFSSLAELARFTEDDWKEIVTRPDVPEEQLFPPSIPGSSKDEKAALYAATIARIVRDAMPTQVLAYRAQADDSAHSDVRRFWANVTSGRNGFQLGRGPVGDYLDQHPALLEGVEDRDGLVAALGVTQRLFKATTVYGEQKALVDAGLDSSLAIARLSQGVFVQRFSDTPMSTERAMLVYKKAASVAATALNLAATYSPSFNRTPMTVVKPPAKQDIPDLETLFGSVSLCECEDCRAIDSPAAYLAEMLAFLKERKQQQTNARDILFERRPDLGELELTCANTNTPLPYVDLVNELLENAIAPFAPFDLPNVVAAELDGATISQTLRTAFAGHGIAVAQASVVVVVKPGERWFVTDHSTLYPILKQGGGAPRVLALAYQTGKSAEELRASPEHVNPAAYAALRAALYPWSLPFDLWWEEARTYLGHLGVQRHELMAEFSRLDRSAALKDLGIASEYLGLTRVEQELVTGGLRARVATTGNLPARSGTPTIDGVATANGDVVLVKDQADATENGLYVVQGGAWTPFSEAGESDVVAVVEGATNAATTWLVRPVAAGVQATAVGPWQLWGLQQVGNQIEHFDPAHPDAPVTTALDWLDALRWVRQFMRRAGLEYEDLVQLLETSYVNPGAIVRIESADATDVTTCDLSRLVLTHLDAHVVDRAHRFVRLWRRLGWSTTDLDKAISGLGGGVGDVNLRLNEALLVKLSHVRRLHTELGLSIEEAVAFWAPIDIAGDDSLYARLFLNPALTPVDPAFVLAGNELAIVAGDPADAKISRHVPTILAALSISAEELASLQSGVLANDDLTLANLSALHRHTVLARGLTLPIAESLTLQALAGINPFDAGHTEDALLFADLVARVRASGFTAADLDYLLFQRSADLSALDPTEDAIAQLLDELRRGLLKIRDATTARPDPAGALTERTLTASLWPSTLVRDVVATLGGTVTYSAALAALPGGLTFPAPLASRVSYDGTAGELRIVGPLSTLERDALLGLSADAPYQAAVTELFAAPREFVGSEMRAYEWPQVSADLAALPAGLTLPRELRDRIYYDAPAQKLRFNGYMTADEETALEALSADAAYRAAIQALRAARLTVALDATNRFLGSADADQLFDVAQLPVDRFAAVLERLLAHQRTTGSRRLVIRQLGESLRLESRLMEKLLLQELPSLSTPGSPAMADFLASAFAESNPSVALTAAGFPNQFKTFVRLQKIGLLVKKLRLTGRQLEWLDEYGAQVPQRTVPWIHGAPVRVRWLRLQDLPADVEARAPARFAEWLRLVDLSLLTPAVPGGEISLSEIFALARDQTLAGPALRAALLQKLSERTGWDVGELTYLASANVLDLTSPDDFQDEVGLTRIVACRRRMRRLGASSEQIRAWAKAQPTTADAEAIRGAAKAVYEADAWLEVAKPLRDELRKKQRDALVAYLLAPHPGPAPPTWADENQLYAHFLIDVEMDPCMTTSRLKQALSSVQLFVQRCRMNLEHEVVADDSTDAGWPMWTWMKNYRVWQANRKIFLYPENWLQPELRDDKTPFFLELENALLQGDVTTEAAEDAFMSYLEELDEVARLEIAGMYYESGAGGSPDILHVFGRTHGRPPVYYYRQWVGQARWTPWERVGLDINEAQVVPVIWNRRLFLFWPVFTEVTDQKSPPPDKPVSPTKHFELQIAWSERKHNRWQAKKVTPDTMKIRSNVPVDDSLADHGRSNHVFRVAIEGAGLHLWYEYDNPSTSFPSRYGSGPQVSNFASVNGFHFLGCDEKLEIFTTSITGLFEPTGTVVDGMFFTERGSSLLNLPTATSPVEGVALNRSPGRFSLLYAHQDGYLTGTRPFFFQDDVKTYFVVPRMTQVVEWIWTNPDWIDPFYVDVIKQLYYEPPPIPDPLGPVEQLFDPVPIEEALAKVEVERVAQPPVVAVGREAAAPAVHALSAAAPVVEEQMRARVEAVIARRTTTFPERTLAVRKTQAAKAIASRKKTDYVVSKGDQAVLPLGDYIDGSRILKLGTLTPVVKNVRRYMFMAFQHPYVCSFMQELNRVGVAGLLKRSTQLQLAKVFKSRYWPSILVEKGDPTTEDKYPVEDVEFTYAGAYAPYNWELFFHVPMLIASKLSQNQRFEDAQRWFHFIFDPTDSSATDVPAKYWRTRPFYEQRDYLKQRIDKLLEQLAKGVPDEELTREVDEWLANPFKPFVVARLRTVAFQKMVVMRYLDNLIAWGDQLFRRDTIESINEATQLYVLAAEILGPKPVTIPPRAEPEVQTYNSLDPKFNALTDKLVDIEQLVGSPRPDSVLLPLDGPPLPIPQMLYFCVPPNDMLLSYWDTVAGRLFKIRHCMNIEGVVRQLPLFEPPIDPALLVKAAAAGIDLSSALGDVAAPMPAYRFATLRQTASELCAEVKALGAALLAALEARDGDALSLLRSQHETALLKRVEQVREQEADEATQQIAALRRSREPAVARYVHYQKLLGVQSPVVPAEGQTVPDATVSSNAAIAEEEGIKMVEREKNELAKLKDSHDEQHTAAQWEFGASIANTLPTMSMSFAPWGIGATMTSPNWGAALLGIAGVYHAKGATDAYDASRAGRLGQFVLREHDWALQANLAAREIMSVDQQIVAAQIREQIAALHLADHRKQIDEAEEIDELLHTKFTNQELYDWRVTQISAVYFQSYQLAYDLAKRAERAFRAELGLADSSFVQFGYWDSLKKGLLAGERLHQDVNRMEVAYLEQNVREYELTKHVSLASLNPEALISLRETGSCFVELPEAIFDLDHPGHYMRRIKSVGVSLPCTTGPYTSVGCKLTLLSNRVRVDPRPTPGYAETKPQDKRFKTDSGGIQSIVTSTAREDTGLFELDLHDARYLPFEYTGAISSWRVELPGTFRQFDYRTISDLVLHVRYHARDGGEPLKKAAVDSLTQTLKAMEVEQGKTGLFRGISGREFPDAWQRFLFKPPSEAGSQQLELLLPKERFAGFLQDPKDPKTPKIDSIVLFVVLKPGTDYDDTDPLTFVIHTPGDTQQKIVSLKAVETAVGGLPAMEASFGAAVPLSATDPWVVELQASPDALRDEIDVDGATVKRLKTDLVRDVGLLCHYTF